MNGDSTEPSSCCPPERCPCTRLFRAFALASNINQLLLSLAAVLAILLGGVLLDKMWSNDALILVERDAGRIVRSELSVFVDSDFSFDVARRFADSQTAGRTVGLSRSTPFAELFRFSRGLVNEGIDAVLNFRLVNQGSARGILGVVAAGVGMFVWTLGAHLGFALLFGAWSLAVYAFFGAAVHRIAVLQAARDERVGLMEALEFARDKWISFVAAPLMPLVILLFLGFLLFMGGLLARLPVLDVLAGLIWILPLLTGLVMGVLAVASIGIWPLMAPAIAAEGTDAFDAFSRAVGYVFERRWRTLFYYLLSIGYGLVCLQIVELLARVTFWTTHAAVGLGMNRFPMSLTSGATMGKLDAIWKRPATDTAFWGAFHHQAIEGTSWAAAGLIHLWVVGFVLLIVAFAFSLCCSSTTLIYLLLRRDVDATEWDSVWTGDDEDAAFDEPSSGETPSKVEPTA